MQVILENLSDLERKLNITIPADRVQEMVKSRLQEVAQTAKIPGFRPGKIPFDIIQKNYGKSAHAQALDALVRDTYPEALEREQLRPVNHPRIEIVSSDVGENFVYSAIFEVFPEIKLVSFEKIEVEKPKSNVVDSDLDKMLEKMRKSQIKWEEVKDPARKAQEGDQLTVDFIVEPHGEDMESKTEKDVKFALGEGMMWGDFEKPLYGVGAGEEKEFTLKLPETHMDKKLAGNKADFKVKVHQLHYPVLPELNDEFAAKMNIKEGGIEKLKDDVRSHMERELEVVLKDLFKKKVMDKLLEHNPIKVPKSLVERELDRLAQNWEQQQASYAAKEKPPFPRDNFIAQAKRSVALGLLFSAIVKENKITASHEEVRKKIEEMAVSYYEDKDDVIKKCLADEEYVRRIESLLLEEKVVEYLASQVNVLEQIMSYQEAMEKKPNA